MERDALIDHELELETLRRNSFIEIIDEDSFLDIGGGDEECVPVKDYSKLLGGVQRGKEKEEIINYHGSTNKRRALPPLRVVRIIMSGAAAAAAAAFVILLSSSQYQNSIDDASSPMVIRGGANTISNRRRIRRLGTPPPPPPITEVIMIAKEGGGIPTTSRINSEKLIRDPLDLDDTMHQNAVENIGTWGGMKKSSYEKGSSSDHDNSAFYQLQMRTHNFAQYIRDELVKNEAESIIL